MSFDSIAPHYRWLETAAFANALQKARIAFLDQISTPRNALIAGEGGGRFLREFTRRFQETRVDCVDSSALMLSLARAQMQSEQAPVHFLQKDLLTWSPDENTYDLIVTHFFLDCFNENEMESIIAKLARSATRNAVWLLADFSVPTQGLARIHAQLWLGAMYRFFRATTQISGRRLIDPSHSLTTAGFRLVSRTLSRFGLIKSELWQRESDVGAAPVPRLQTRSVPPTFRC